MARVEVIESLGTAMTGQSVAIMVEQAESVAVFQCPGPAFLQRGRRGNEELGQFRRARRVWTGGVNAGLAFCGLHGTPALKPRRAPFDLGAHFEFVQRFFRSDSIRSGLSLLFSRVFA